MGVKLELMQFRRLEEEALSLESLMTNQVEGRELRCRVEAPFEAVLRASLNAAESTGNLDGQRDDRPTLEEKAIDLFSETRAAGVVADVWVRNLRYAHLGISANPENTFCDVRTISRRNTIQDQIDATQGERDTEFLKEKVQKLVANPKTTAANILNLAETTLSDTVLVEGILGPGTEVTQRKINLLLESYGYKRVEGKKSLKRYIVGKERNKLAGRGRNIFKGAGVILIPTVKNGEVVITGHSPRAKAESSFVNRIIGKKTDYGNQATVLFIEKFFEACEDLQNEDAWRDELIEDSLMKLGISRRRSKILADRIKKGYTGVQGNA